MVCGDACARVTCWKCGTAKSREESLSLDNRASAEMDGIMEQLACHRSKAFVEPYEQLALERKLPMAMNVCAALRGLCCRFEGTVGETGGRPWCRTVPYCARTLGHWSRARRAGADGPARLLERMRHLRTSLKPSHLVCLACRADRKRKATDDVQEAKRRRMATHVFLGLPLV